MSDPSTALCDSHELLRQSLVALRTERDETKREAVRHVNDADAHMRLHYEARQQAEAQRTEAEQALAAARAEIAQLRAFLDEYADEPGA